MGQAFQKQQETLHFTVLPAFAGFVERDHLHDFASTKLKLARAYQLPFLKHVAHMNDDQVIALLTENIHGFLSALTNDQGEEYIQEMRTKWQNEHPHILLKKSDLQLNDIIFLGYIRKKVLLSFAPEFAKDVAQYHLLNDEIDAFFIRFNLVYSEAFMEMHHEQQLQKTQLEERELRLKVAMETTGLGVCDYDLITGKILASESCRTVFGWGNDSVVTFDDFMNRIDESEREHVAQGITQAILGEQKFFEAEFPILREDGETRWLKAQGKVLTDEEQTPVRMIGTILDITEAKSSETQLRASEQQFRQLADSMPQLIWESARNGKVTYLNRKWMEYTGTDGNMAGDWDSVHPEDIPVAKLFWEVSIETGTTYDAEVRLRNRDGEYRWFLVRALPVRDDAGNILKWYGTCTDVHEQKLVDESLQLQAHVLENMEEAVVICDEAGFITYMNKAEELWFGYEPGELIGKHVTVLNAYDEQENDERVSAVIMELRTKGSWDGEWYNLRKDGTTFYTAGHISTLELGDEKFSVSVQRDITQEKRARQILAESEERFRKLADDAPMFVWMADEKANITYCNKELLGYTGYTDYSYVTGRIWETVTHPEDLFAIFTVYIKAIQDLQPFTADARFKSADGEYRWFRFKGVPRTQNGVLKGFIGTATDIHEQKTLNEELERRVKERTEDLMAANVQLERSNKELELFAYVASHDLHEPLRKIQSFADILTEKSNGTLNEEGKVLLEKMHGAAGRMRLLIDDLLLFSRVSANDNSKDMINLNDLVQDVLGDLETAVHEKDARIEARSLAPVYGNQLQLRQLFKNILGNSLQFSRNGQPALITISSEKVYGRTSKRSIKAEDQDREFQLITIHDNGTGFEQEHSEQIFELFNKKQGKTSYTVTGIGLSVAKKAVEKHNGYIWAESTPGEGASFHILLPYSTEVER